MAFSLFEAFELQSLKVRRPRDYQPLGGTGVPMPNIPGIPGLQAIEAPKLSLFIGSLPNYLYEDQVCCHADLRITLGFCYLFS